MEPVAIATGAAKNAGPWAATLAVLSGVTLENAVLIATLVYTVLQIALSVRKWIKEK